MCVNREKDDDEGIPSETEEDKRLLETKAREIRGKNLFCFFHQILYNLMDILCQCCV